MNQIEKTGKTVAEAVSDALSALGITQEEAEITVLEEPAKGFLGIGSKPARVLVVEKYNPVKVAKNFLREISQSMKIDFTTDITFDGKLMNIELIGTDMGVMIGKRGQTLDSLQYLVNLVINKGNSSYISITLDAEDYRARRKESLELLARNLAKKVKQTRRSVMLEPMNPYERRIIHSCLQNDKAVTTHSEGEEPFRNVVIVYKRESKF